MDISHTAFFSENNSADFSRAWTINETSPRKKETQLKSFNAKLSKAHRFANIINGFFFGALS